MNEYKLACSQEKNSCFMNIFGRDQLIIIVIN